MKKQIDEIVVGEYLVKNKTKRLQGEKIKTPKGRVNFFALLFSLAVIAAMLLVSLFSIQGGFCYTTQNKFIKFPRAAAMQKTEGHPYKAMAVMERTSGRLLDCYNETEKLPIASTTKIMTALVALEGAADLTIEQEVPLDAVGIEGTSMYLKKGEKFSALDLLYGLMLPSGNDAATALAIIVSGSEEKFVSKMNEKAESLGLGSTHFENPHGLHNENHYSSAKDLAIITSAAMNNEKFMEVFGARNAKVKGTTPEEPRHFKSKQKLFWDKGLEREKITILGGKTGFTPEAGRCLVSAARNADGLEVVSVVLNAPEMFESSAKVLSGALKNFKKVNLISPKMHLTSIPVVGSKTDSVNVFTKTGFSYPLSGKEEALVKIQYNYPELLYAPIEKEQKVGEVVVMLSGETLAVVDILTLDPAANESVFELFKNILAEF